MPHVGILAADPDGAAQCFLRYCRAGAAALGGHTFGTDVEVPAPEDAQRLDGIIFGELVDGSASEASRAWCVEVVRGLADRGCDAVTLASTELPLLLASRDSPLPVIDSIAVLAGRALEVALGHAPLPTWRGGRHTDLRAPSSGPAPTSAGRCPAPR